MIAHLCRLTWNRRRTNLLLVAELLLSFLVLTPLIVALLLFAAEELQPLGFQHDRLWYTVLQHRDTDYDPSEFRSDIEHARRELRALDGVKSVALANEVPLLFWVSWNGAAYVEVSDEGLETLGLRLLSGRWFRPEDEALDWTPAVIDQEASRALFGDEDPLGKEVGDSPVLALRDGYDSPHPDRVRVVGVVENCFYYGRFGPADVEVPGLAFLRISHKRLTEIVSNTNTFSLLVQSRAGAGPALGEALGSRIQAIFPADRSIGFEVMSLAAVRDDNRAYRLRMLWRIARISGLMMVVVTLGLIGIMWQNVRRRTREIGIRRAVGASGLRICGHFLGELTVLVTVAIALGCVSIVQFELLDKMQAAFWVFWSRVPAHVAAWGAGATALVLYLAVLICGLYPGWLAARVKPAEALHHD